MDAQKSFLVPLNPEYWIDAQTPAEAKLIAEHVTAHLTQALDTDLTRVRTSSRSRLMKAVQDLQFTYVDHDPYEHPVLFRFESDNPRSYRSDLENWLHFWMHTQPRPWYAEALEAHRLAHMPEPEPEPEPVDLTNVSLPDFSSLHAEVEVVSSEPPAAVRRTPKAPKMNIGTTFVPSITFDLDLC